MKSKLSSIVVVFLFLAAIFSGERSYKNARRYIVSDLNRALSETLARIQTNALTPDTVSLFRDNLVIPELKDSTYISYCLPGDKPSGLCSEIMMLDEMEVRSYADISFASVMGIADKRMPIALSALAFLWLFGSMALTRKKQDPILARLTPMQRQLFDMFMSAEDGKLSKDDICNALWPNKPQAEETLYSLIRHFKSSIAGSGYEIETRRGFGYRLKKR
ncbi:MAG: helix-turn-helix domain-containing protein [Bacteroidales bacterium]|nr:helix-turn-helix domain-containing protein [Bacteroidales bacterium]